MRNQSILGYTINNNITHFTPNTVLFSRGTESITVSMVNDALDYVLDVIAHKNPLVKSYKVAKTVLNALKLRLCNIQSRRPNKKDLITTIDVLKEISNSNAESEEQKEYNERQAFICKLLIEFLY